MPKVSVIIPTYDRRHHLGLAIESVLAQTLEDFELIIVDDGSNDDTEDLVRGLSDPRVRYQWRTHGGISAAMNTGLALACGELIARLDSDDVWLPHLLAIEVEHLEAHPEVGVVYARAQAMDTRGGLLKRSLGLPQRYPGEDFRSILYEDYTCNITTLARRECLDRAGPYDETLVANEDWDMWTRVARHCRFAFVDQILARFLLHDGNLTGPRSAHLDTVVETRSRVLEKVFSQKNLPADVLAMEPLAYRNLYTWAGVRLLEARRPGSALPYFGRAVRSGANPCVAALRILWLAGIADLFGRPKLDKRVARLFD